jgi:hypothetical protein
LPTKRPPGRPTPEDEELELRRNELVHLLSVSWADIAWQVRRASTREEFRKALEPLIGRGQDHLISHFVRFSAVTTNGKEVRATRRKYVKANDHTRETDKKHDEIFQLHGQIGAAMLEADPDELKVLQTDFAKYETELRSAAEKLNSAKMREETLKNWLEALEASFAQEELAEIIRENRCARNPLRIANAMAGLPVLSARVSYVRCSKIKCPVWPRFEFLVIKFIESTWNRRHRYSNLSTVALFDQEIKRLSKTIRREELPESIAQSIETKRIENPLRSHLGKNRRFLRLAIEKSIGTSDIDQTRIPFLIASNFTMILGEPRTPLTLALAERERIDN